MSCLRDSYIGYRTLLAEVRNPGPPPTAFRGIVEKLKDFSLFLHRPHKNPVVDPRSIELTAHSLFVVRISEILANFRSHFVVIISEILAHFRIRLADGFQFRESLFRPLSLLGGPLRGAGLVRQNQTFAEIEVARWVVFVARWVFFVALDSCGKFRSLRK